MPLNPSGHTAASSPPLSIRRASSLQASVAPALRASSPTNGQLEDQVGAERAQVAPGRLVDREHRDQPVDAARCRSGWRPPAHRRRRGMFSDAPDLDAEPLGRQRAHQLHEKVLDDLGVEAVLVDLVVTGDATAQECQRLGQPAVGVVAEDLLGRPRGGGEELGSELQRSPGASGPILGARAPVAVRARRSRGLAPPPRSGPRSTGSPARAGVVAAADRPRRGRRWSIAPAPRSCSPPWGRGEVAPGLRARRRWRRGVGRRPPVVAASLRGIHRGRARTSAAWSRPVPRPGSAAGPQRDDLCVSHACLPGAAGERCCSSVTTGWVRQRPGGRPEANSARASSVVKPARSPAPCASGWCRHRARR